MKLLTSIRLLSSTSHLDTTLLTITYTLHFVHSYLLRLPIPIPILTSLIPSLPPLTALIDETRIFLRLWSLLGIYTWGVSTYNSPPSDWILKYIAWAQVGVNAIYQALENAAFLGDKGVLRDVPAKTRARWWVWSSRAWMAHVGLEGIRLGREWMLSHQRKIVAQRREFLNRKNKQPQATGAVATTIEETEEKTAEWAEETRWWREVAVNAAYAPMTVHWSTEEGILGEGSVGALGIVAGYLGIREAWRKTA